MTVASDRLDHICFVRAEERCKRSLKSDPSMNHYNVINLKIGSGGGVFWRLSARVRVCVCVCGKFSGGLQVPSWEARIKN